MLTESLIKFNKNCISKLPINSGVYRFYDSEMNLLYVGKAKNIKSRVKSYIMNADNTNERIKYMIRLINFIELNIVDNETDALLLENNFIKTLKPKFNILLRDDKSYPWIALSESKFPRIFAYRGNKKKSLKLFGPYPNAKSVKENIRLFQNIFKIRTCTDSIFKSRIRPCLLYQIKKCSAPCVKKISQYNYDIDIKNVIKFLSGQTKEVISSLKNEMQEFSNSLEFENAEQKKRQILILESLKSNNVVSKHNKDNFLVIAVATISNTSIIHVMEYIQGYFSRDFAKVFHNSSYKSNEIIVNYLQQNIEIFFEKKIEVITEFNLKNIETLLLFEKKYNTSFKFTNPKRGIKLDFLELCKKNAIFKLDSFVNSENNVRENLNEIEKVFCISKKVNRIECIDISHTSGSFTVGSCVVFDKLKLMKKDYRKYNIETNNNDYLSIEILLRRKFKRLIDEKLPLPDILMIDGGIGQLNISKKILQEFNLDIFLIAISKGKKRIVGDEKLIFYSSGKIKSIELGKFSKILILFQQIRDEAHRFAISGHRKAREKSMTTSKLSEIIGVGPVRKKQLLLKFGNIKSIANASIVEISKVDGFNTSLAENIYDFFH